ncbi:MAG: glycosyltransferase family A protein [Vicinamibacterales bacterium]
MTIMTRGLRRLAWSRGAAFDRHPGRDLPSSLTVLVAFHHPARMRHLDGHVRNVLACPFVERLVVLNDNPEVALAPRVACADPRLIVIDQPRSHGCGHRWVVARRFRPDHLVVIDDDVLLRPSQIARLFRALLAEPDRVHGFSGLVETGDGRLEAVGGATRSVDLVMETYALTGAHLDRYAALRDRLAITAERRALIDGALDFVLVSRAGDERPMIHRIGRVLRCETFDTPGIAVHQTAGFAPGLHRLREDLARLDAAPAAPRQQRSSGQHV